MENAQWLGQANIAGNSEFAQMFLLTVSVAGLQFTWGVEMSYVNVYLLSLGMSKSMLSVVWVAGPLSGLLMQPLVGVLSDNSTSPYGRRRPYIMLGSCIVSIGLIVMAWAKSIVGIFVDSQILTIWLAVAAVFATDFAVNAVQACCRAIIVDVLPTSKQQVGNGWAGRMIAVGHLLGYFAGYIDLVQLFNGWLGDTQLKSLCIISSISLLFTAGVTCYSVTEQVLVNPLTNHYQKQPIVKQIKGIFANLLSTVWTLPLPMRLILKTQLCAWYGWFTFLFYSSTWVSEVYIKHASPSTSNDNPASKDTVGNLARVGSMSMMAFSIVSLVCSWVLPELVKNRVVIKLPFGGAKILSLTGLWLAAHLIYSFVSLCTGFVNSVTQATTLVAIYGFTWAITTWAPFALLAEEILKLTGSEYEYELASSVESNLPPEIDHDSFPNATAADSTSGEGGKSGIYLGIHNVAITLPQFVSTLGSFVIFSMLDKSTDKDSLPSHPGDGDGGRAVAWTLQVGSITSLFAAYFVQKLQNLQQ